MLPNIGFGEMVIILVVALLFFGAKRLPELAKSVGKSLNAFKKGMKEDPEEKESLENNKPDPPESA